MTNLRIGLIGTAHHNRWFLAECLKDQPADIVAAADADDASLSAFASHYRVGSTYSDPDRMLLRESLDAVFIFPGGIQVTEYALTSIERGIAVYADKNVARTLEDIEALETALAKHPVAFAVRLNKPLVPAYRAALSLLGRDPTRGGIGRPLVFSSDFHAGPYGSLRNFLENHIVFHYDLAYDAIGPFTVRDAIMNATGDATVGVIATLSTDHGTIGVVNASSYSPGDTPKERVEVIASAGIVRVENGRRVKVWRGTEASSAFGTPVDPDGINTQTPFGLTWEGAGAHLSTSTRNGYEEQVAAFVARVLAGGAEWKPTVDRLAHHINRFNETWRVLSRQRGRGA